MMNLQQTTQENLFRDPTTRSLINTDVEKYNRLKAARAQDLKINEILREVSELRETVTYLRDQIKRIQEEK